MDELRTQQPPVVQQWMEHLHPAGHQRQHAGAGGRQLGMQRAIQQLQLVALLTQLHLAAFTHQALITQPGGQRVAQGRATLQQVTEHAERAGSKVAAQGQAWLAMFDATEVLPQLLLRGEGYARVGVTELAVAQPAAAHQLSAINTQAARSMQHGEGDAGADRGVL